MRINQATYFRMRLSSLSRSMYPLSMSDSILCFIWLGSGLKRTYSIFVASTTS